MKKRQRRNTLDDVFAKDDSPPTRRPRSPRAVRRRSREARCRHLRQGPELPGAEDDSGPGLSCLRQARPGRTRRAHGAPSGTPRRGPRRSGSRGARRETRHDRQRRDGGGVARARPSRPRRAPESSSPTPSNVPVSSPMREAGVVACLVPGMFELDPASDKGIYWLERVLGARSAPPWLYGALVAAQALPDERGRDGGSSPTPTRRRSTPMHDDFEELEQVARETLDILGKPAPPFDDDTKFARAVPPAELGAALLRPRQARRGRSSRTNRRNEPRRRRCTGSGRVARGLLAIQPLRARERLHERRSEAVALLRAAGEVGERELGRLRALPEIGDWAKAMCSMPPHGA